MNISLLGLLVFASVFVSVALAEEDPEKAWASFKAKHGKEYGSKSAEKTRKANFLKAHSVIIEHNKRSAATFKCGHNDLSDRSAEELENLLGEIPSPAKNGRNAAIREETSEETSSEETEYTSRQAVPSSYDLRSSTKCVGPVKNQGSCGSCWAFSTIASMEYSQCNVTGTFVGLSEQMLLDCDTVDLACGGGYPAYSGVWPWLKSNNMGISTQASYPYTGVKGTCQYNANSLGSKGVDVYGGPVASDVASIQKAILAYGLVRASVYVKDNAFYYYTSGVYTSTACSTLSYGQTNHAVNLVGWTTSSGIDAWIMRNSWGSSWGTAGYMLIKRGVNLCNIESKIGWVRVKA